MKKTIRNIFQEGAISPEFIAESIAKHQSKTGIGAHDIFLGQVRADVVEDKEVKAIEFTAYEEMANQKAHEVKEAAIEAVRRYGTGCAGSRFLNGTLAIHEELEARLAEFLRKDAAIVFPTGFQANLGAVSALVGKDDLVVIDLLAPRGQGLGSLGRLCEEIRAGFEDRSGVVEGGGHDETILLSRFGRVTCASARRTRLAVRAEARGVGKA